MRKTVGSGPAVDARLALRVRWPTARLSYCRRRRATGVDRTNVGKLLVFVGLIIGVDWAGTGPAGFFGAILGMALMLLGLAFLRWSRPRP